MSAQVAAACRPDTTMHSLSEMRPSSPGMRTPTPTSSCSEGSPRARSPKPSSPILKTEPCSTYSRPIVVSPDPTCIPHPVSLSLSQPPFTHTPSMGGRKPEALCLVCGDRASGKHYGVQSCDGCRGFFKRSIRRNLDYVCKEKGACVVDVARRNQCQACRFRKCLDVNMNRDAVQHERAPRCYQYKRESPDLSRDDGPPDMPPHFPSPAFLDRARYGYAAFSPYTPPVTSLPPDMSYHHAQMLASAALHFPIEAHKRPDFHNFPEQQELRKDQRSPVSKADDDRSEKSQPRTPPVVSSAGSSLSHGPSGGIQPPSVLMSLPPPPPGLPPPPPSGAENIYESAARLLFLAVKWARNIPAFLQLPFRDQAILLEESWSELFLLSAAQWSLPLDTGALLAANGVTMEAAHMEKGSSLAAQIRTLQDILRRFTGLRVDATEYACLKALVLFKSDIRGLRDPSHVGTLQDQAQLMLLEYTATQCPTDRVRFGKVLLLLPALRAVGARTLEDIFFRRTIGSIPIERLLCDMFKSS